MQSSPAPKTQLDKAYSSILAMEKAKTLDDFEENWKNFLFQLERCFNKAQAHYKKSPKWDSWWGKYKKLRTSDELLSYLIKARGAEEHSVEEIVKRHESGIGINAAKGNAVYIESITFDELGNINIKSPQDLKITFIPERMILLPVSYYDRIYDVPKRHLGKDIDSNDVCSIARLAHAFYSTFLLSAEQYFVK